MARRNYYVIRKTDMAFALSIVFMLGIVFAAVTLPQAQSTKSIPIESERQAEIRIAAVDAEGSGVTGLLIATVRPGSGQVLVSVNDVLAQFDTQFSARIAAKAASRFTSIYAGNLDIIYTIKVNATAIEGPSAGSTMAVATVLALQNKTAPSDIMMTGAISEDGRILPVGAIFEKAKAAKETGAKLFLVPEGQSIAIEHNRIRTCSNTGGITYCRIEYHDTDVNVGQQLGIDVKEVKNLAEAVAYFTNSTA